MRQIKSKRDLANEGGTYSENTIAAFDRIHGKGAFQALPDTPEPEGTSKKRSEMSNSEKSDYIDQHGRDAYFQLPQ